MIQDFLEDLRYGWRVLLRSPAFTIISVLTLGLAIGANAAVFSVLNGMLLNAVPYPDSKELVAVWSHDTRQGIEKFEVSPADFVDLRRNVDGFEAVGAAVPYRNLNMTGEGEPERLNVSLLTHEVVPLLGLAPVVGSSFTAKEDIEGNEFYVLLSYGFWQRRFGGDSEVIGDSITLNDRPYTVLGVMHPDFRFPRSGIDVWIPMALTEEDALNRSFHVLEVIGRRKATISQAQLSAELDTLSESLAETYPASNEGFQFNPLSMQEEETKEIRQTLWILQGVVALILLLACANLGNLLLARALMRSREIAVRGALGAVPRRLLKQFLTEGLLLALLGGLVGLTLAWWGLQLLPSLIPQNLPPNLDLGKAPALADLELDGSVLLFTLGVSLIAVLLFALAPALHSLRLGLVEELREGGRSAGQSQGGRLRNILVVAQVAIAVILLTGAGLMIRTFVNLYQIEPGFPTDNLLTLRISLPGGKYAPTQRDDFFRQATEQIRQLPGVEDAGIISVVPLIGYVSGSTLTVEGRSLPANELPTVAYRAAGPEIQSTLGIPLRQGQWFDDFISPDSPPVAVINETAAQLYWPDEEAVGRRIKLGNNPEELPWITITGVVGDIADMGLDAEIWPTFYTPYSQNLWTSMNLIVRTTANPNEMLPSVRNVIRSLDPNQPIYDVRTSEELLILAVVKQRFAATLMGVFAFIALIMAAAGIYGVMSHSVYLRTQEIGVRMALGADRTKIMIMVFRDALSLVAIGLAVGLLGALAMTRVLKNLLYNVAPTDLMTFGLVATMLIGVAIVACYLPARRATRLDPIPALRAE